MKQPRLKNTSYRFLLPFILLTISLLLPGTSNAFPGGKIDKFSADQVELSKDGKTLNTLKIYVTPDAFRMDGMPGAGMNPNMPKTNLSMLTLKNKNELYTLNHDKKLYCVTSVDENNTPASMKGYKDAQQIKELGKETISGYKCIKKEITSTVKMMGMTSTSKALIWESNRFEMPLRIQSQEGYISEIRNIKTGAPSGSLFKLPKGYTKVDNMMLVMGMDFGNMGTHTNTEPDQDTPGNQNSPQELEKALKGLGDKLKNFKFGN